MLRMNSLTRVATVGAVLALAACSENTKILAPSLKGGDIFKSYVAMGNSITAGYQSGGINDSTQRQSYAFLLAGQMGTQYHYAALAKPGCPPPIANTQTGARVGGATAPPCALRIPTSVTDILNNVAVPGARVLDPISGTTVASNALTTFILGGKSQVQRALDADPTFATIWIGNNDVLEAGASGILVPIAGVSPGIVSTQTQFQASYDAMITQLTDSEPNLKGVLIGVVQVAGVPLLQSGALIFSTLISCQPGVVPGTLVGDIFVLDATEQATLAAAITGYNNYIKTKADAIGFAYYDPNVLLAAKRATGEIPPFPNLASTNATFGPLISLDGIHPGAAAHKLIANDLIALINGKYATSIPAVP